MQCKNVQNDKGPLFKKYFSEFILKLIGHLLIATNLFLKFQGSSCNSFRYFADKISSIFVQRAITQERGIILIRRKICQLFIHEESIYENSKP